MANKQVQVMKLNMIITSTPDGMATSIDIEGDSVFHDFIHKYKELLEGFHTHAVDICVDHANTQNLIEIPINQKPRYWN
ncbi:hypothetical protein Bresa_00632|uniref:Uncharacterized protein n=1 Tax=Brenneria salicis ATCC 15712 = DSM 30166 TaxID=714314 RepID=A0A366I7F3_9GAMM|nr:hypothetical protein [Brenneria salicis]NMN90556.1 hypothetical protein [Brenneria salicis ATCC 15712 = DSM 30166]RBP64887.1 hypothetical protein DES54_106112 [Brenneria salicis ATCC 15712 = DSM 30166]RLM31603.1 hypothetical protein BHG07_04925 [Brenneria salicis ATCC 15712 = DSM 30166]